ncbi:hypothetical protein [Streptomyces sp. NRRL S-337]|uniref:hypothetical protein n=1 Tax=Streptomyces sp. NRRL S-337 TaxID=1463900 RepID=UPI001F205F6E|nr:hypothetical protein [Streptomyces sp. NRRL S-337]
MPHSSGGPRLENQARARHFVVIGSDEARRVCGFLQSAGHTVRHLAQPTDEDLRRALDQEATGIEVAGVAILSTTTSSPCATRSRSSTSAQASCWW